MNIFIEKKYKIDFIESNTFAPAYFLFEVPYEDKEGYVIKISENNVHETSKYPGYYVVSVNETFNYKAYKYNKSEEEKNIRFKRFDINFEALSRYYISQETDLNKDKIHVLYSITKWVKLRGSMVYPEKIFEIGILHENSIYSMSNNIRHNKKNKTISIIKEIEFQQLNKYINLINGEENVCHSIANFDLFFQRVNFLNFNNKLGSLFNNNIDDLKKRIFKMKKNFEKILLNIKEEYLDIITELLNDAEAQDYIKNSSSLKLIDEKISYCKKKWKDKEVEKL